MKTLNQLRAEVLAEFEKRCFAGVSLNFADYKAYEGRIEELKDFFSSKLNEIAQGAIKSVEVEEKEPDCAKNPDYPMDLCTPNCGYNAAIQEAKRRKDIFLNE